MDAAQKRTGGLWGIALALAWAVGPASGQANTERVDWEQGEAKKMVSEVLKMEAEKKQPWNSISWEKDVATAVAAAKKSRKPLFVFFFVERDGPPKERCGLEGRLIRGRVLSNAKVAAHIKAKYVPVKIKLEKGKDFPVAWPALKRWAGAYKYSTARGFAGCSVVSSDLEIEYGNSGPAKIADLLSARAFDSTLFLAMLERAAARALEERSIRAQRGLEKEERAMEIQRFREGVSRAVKSEGRSSLPPRGYTLEQALELYKVAGVSAEK